MTQASEDFRHLVGTVLSGRYLIKSLLGEGGMGAVFEGEHTLMHKRVAIKLLRPEVSQSAEVVQRFEREAMASAHIDHPNVVAATDFGHTDDGSFFLVLEFIEGQNLRNVLLRGPLAPSRALHVIDQVASVLVRAHGLGIVHRDLKPENVMLVERDGDPDFVKVLDFGIAKVPVDALHGAQVPTAQGLTQLGVMYGTPEYMAPEQAMGTGVDHRADLYALGVILFEMVTGVRPFDDENVISLVTKHIAEPPPPLHSRTPPHVSLPVGLEELVAALLEKDRDRRPASAREVVDRVRAMLPSADDRSPGRASMVGSPPPSAVGVPPSSQGAQELHGGFAMAQTSIEASPVAPSGAGYLPTAQIPLPTEPRWRRELREALPELERMKAQLPGPLARLPLVVFPVAVIGVMTLVALLIALPRKPSPAGEGPALAASTVSPGLRDADIEEARKSGVPALEALGERFPEDVRMQRALMRAYHEAHRPTDSIKLLAKLARTEKDPLNNDLAVNVLRAALDGPAEATDAAFSLLESGLGDPGYETLYAIWTAKKEVNSKAQARAGKILTRSDVKEKLPKPLRALVDLKVTPAGCETRRAGVELAREAGDARAVPLLQALTSKRGCGFAGIQDCWPCLRRDSALNDAIKAAEKRPEP